MNVQGAIRFAHSVSAKVGDGALGCCLVFVGRALRPIVRSKFRSIRAHHRDDIVPAAIKKCDAIRIVAQAGISERIGPRSSHRIYSSEFSWIARSLGNAATLDRLLKSVRSAWTKMVLKAAMSRHPNPAHLRY